MPTSRQAQLNSFRCRPNNTNTTILRIDIDQIRSTGLSFMPEGLEAALAPQAMADLLAYLNSIE